MTIFAGSRYENQQVYIVREGDEPGPTPAIYGPIAANFSHFAYYIVQNGDRFDSLAGRFLGDPNNWWMIADLNPQVFYPDSLQPGSMLRIPTS